MSIKNFSAAISVIALLTSCVSYNNPDFGGFRAVEFTESDKMEIAIEKNYLAPTQDHPKMGKFTFRFLITEVNTRFSSITVNQMTAQYKDGTVQKLARPWKKDLASLTRRPDRPLSLNVESLFFRHEDVTVTLEGFVTTENGERVPFFAREKFKAGADRGYINLLLNPWAYT